jgi:hypothetical protein
MLGSSHHREDRPASAARERDRFAVDGGEPSVCLVARFLLLDVADNVQESRTRRVPIRFVGTRPALVDVSDNEPLLRAARRGPGIGFASRRWGLP